MEKTERTVKKIPPLMFPFFSPSSASDTLVPQLRQIGMCQLWSFAKSTRRRSRRGGKRTRGFSTCYVRLNSWCARRALRVTDCAQADLKLPQSTFFFVSTQQSVRTEMPFSEKYSSKRTLSFETFPRQTQSVGEMTGPRERNSPEIGCSLVLSLQKVEKR